MVKKAPAPWNLTGNGYVILYWFKKENLKDKCFLDDSLKESYLGGRGCVMLVDYKSSDVGPYKELLFIPGKINFNGKKLYTISKIFVSTLDSVVNGRENWGIPKEHANFSWMSDKHTEKIFIEHDGHEFFSANNGANKIPVYFSANDISFTISAGANNESKGLLYKFSWKGNWLICENKTNEH